MVDDEPSCIELAKKILGLHEYTVVSETDPTKALPKIKADPPDLLLLDVCMPQMNGLDVCRAMKEDKSTQNVPIIFVSVKADDADVVAGLEIGAEDYIEKPMREPVLLARVRAAFRRQDGSQKSRELVCGPFRVDFDKYAVFMDDEQLDLSAKQFELFAFMAKNEGKVLTRATISEAVWGADVSRLSRRMDTMIDQIRKKLGSNRDLLRSLRGVGYRLDSE